MTQLIIVAWILVRLDAPWWVWLCLALWVVSEARALPMYLRIVARFKQ